MFAVQLIIEKAFEHQISQDILFFDFSQAFCSIKKTKPSETLQQLGMPSKLMQLTTITMRAARVRIEMQSGSKEELTIKKGVI